MRLQPTAGDSSTGGHRRLARRALASVIAALALLGASAPGCGKGASPAAAPGDAAADSVQGEAGILACPASDAGTPTGVADDFGPNAKAGATSSALGQLNVYEVTSARRLEWIDLYLRADLAGTRVTVSVYEAAARNLAFRRLLMLQLDIPPCSGWVASGPVELALEPGRFYAIGYDPNQAVTAFVDSEASNLPVDGQFGRLIGSKTSTSVSLDTLDWGKPSDKDFTRQRLYTSPRAASDAGVDGPDTGADASSADSAVASDARG